MLRLAGPVLIVSLLAPTLCVAHPTSRQGTIGKSGIVVDEVRAGGTADRVGIKSGDVLISWTRAANPPSNRKIANGAFHSPFDIHEVETEQEPRGKVTLLATREGRSIKFSLPSGAWRVSTRPPFKNEALDQYFEGRRLFRDECPDEGTRQWRALAAGSDSTVASWLLLQTAQALERVSGRWLEAYRAYEEAIAQARLAGDHRAEAQIWRRESDLFEVLHVRDSRIQARQEAVSLRELQPDEPLALADDLDALCDSYKAASKADCFRRALAIREHEAPYSIAVVRAQKHLGDALGDPEHSALLLRALLLVQRLDPESLDAAAVLNDLCIDNWFRGDLEAAESFGRRAVAIRSRLEPNELMTGWYCINLGNVYSDSFDLETAERLYGHALELFEKIEPLSADTAGALDELGNVALDREQLDEAEHYYKRALDLHEALGFKGEAALSLGNLGEVARKRGNLEEADRYFAEELRRHETHGRGPRALADSLQAIADTALAKGDLAKAEAFYRRCLDVREPTMPGSQSVARALHGLGAVYRKQGRLPEAERCFRRATEALDSQRGKLAGGQDNRSRFGASYGDYYRDYIDLLMQVHRERDAFHVQERSRARSFLAILAERDLALEQDMPATLDQERREADSDFDETEARLSRLDFENDPAKIDKLRSHLVEIRAAQAEISERIKKVSPRYAALKYPQPLNLADAQAALDPGTLLLAYSVAAEHTFLFVLSSEEREQPLSVFTLPIGEKALRESVAVLRTLVEWDKPSELTQRARSLYDTLIKPAESLISTSDRLLILPDGPLHTLPWASLVREVKDGQPKYLAESKPIHTAASATVFAELKKSRRKRAIPPAIEVTSFGDPTYPKPLEKKIAVVKRGDGGVASDASPPIYEIDEVEGPQLRAVARWGYRLDPLPASRKEVQEITSLYAPRSVAYIGSNATEEKAKSVGKDVPLIHFACHAIIDERFPLDSALVFTIPAHRKAGQDNGLLQAWEIFEKVRIDADLVTLSACESGLGKEMGGEGLIGLTRAFQYAGARSVLASLWKVEDASTGELMKRFYGYLKGGKTKDEALRLAQVDLIHSPNFSRPHDWAAFELIGDWK